MTLASYCLRGSAMLCGGALIAAQILFNLEDLGKGWALSGLHLATIAVPVATAVAVVVMNHAFGQRQYLFAGVALVTVLCGIAHTFSIALERGVHARERMTAARESENAGYHLALKAHEDALARVRELEAATAAPCKTTNKDGSPTRACVAARETLSKARSWATEKQGELAEAGVPVNTKGMARYGTLAEVLNKWHPALLPMAMEFGGLVLLGFAFARRPTPQVHDDAATRIVTKVDEAIAEIRKLKAAGDTLPPVRELAQRIGHSPTTTHRALRLIGS